jgi:hypothetical protein
MRISSSQQQAHVIGCSLTRNPFGELLTGQPNRSLGATVAGRRKIAHGGDERPSPARWAWAAAPEAARAEWSNPHRAGFQADGTPNGGGCPSGTRRIRPTPGANCSHEDGQPGLVAGWLPARANAALMTAGQAPFRKRLADEPGRRGPLRRPASYPPGPPPARALVE